MATRLLEAGAAAVVAMGYSVYAVAAAEFMAAFYEALFRSYSAIYQPEKLPPYKFEVHVFTTQQEFHRASGAWGRAS